ncbi:MAG TPA: hypothetical protein VEK57_00725 [Thermoanaerobaculia bacterium]|nr:hypothetical protein [Thermoanaerobaculia bacterium]
MNIFFSEPARVLLLVTGCAVLWSLESVVPLYAFRDRRMTHVLPNIGLTVLLLLTNLVHRGDRGEVCRDSPGRSAVSRGAAAVGGRPRGNRRSRLLRLRGARVLLHKMPLAWRLLDHPGTKRLVDLLAMPFAGR